MPDMPPLDDFPAMPEPEHDSEMPDLPPVDDLPTMPEPLDEPPPTGPSLLPLMDMQIMVSYSHGCL